jgi:CysZ protein
MLDIVARSLNQLADPRVRAVLLKSIGLTIAILAVLLAAIWYGIGQIQVSQRWLQGVIDVLGVLADILLAWVLFAVVASIVVSFFLDEVADAVEAKHYPGLAPARRQTLHELVIEGLRFAGVTILLNVLALPVYIFLPAINILVFYGLNGYLLSREYFELVAFRRIAPPDARRVRLAHPATMLLLGAFVAFLLTVPIVNLIAPVLATALMVHVYHKFAGAGTARR